ncbi:MULTISPECIES: tRNA pseudouridine(38-40) synthase TruA [Halobacterium]|uniref:tRNA pseudouridine(38-40) synthase TruA n=1 Tax=Halobacterium TaxID=2239 RepID=UPI001966204A|nr:MULTISPECIES: tRNA pseudouridine(38-40) synthase TruA [Halobacterium]MDL0128562.1 tRNA pseudouridine(38-40) synthase TruA [Halobacterium salinarum]MDL0134848.1 tRNA pseudouridine(38-40) synthase TruA [Halobacterium salinarum]QRY24312.1 tRNA pseudouridine(38-40) synthase TruA [Halobacterium sp. BOL4-2]
MPRRAFRVAYDGRPYHGFQRQPDVSTVAGELFGALRRLDVFDGAKPSGYAAAGRTDAGVSARAQTVAFDAPAWLTPDAFTGALPDPIQVWAHADAPPEFHATHDAVARTYVYYWYAPDSRATDDRAAGALDRLTGTHDFHNLTPNTTNTVRELDATLDRDGAFRVITVRAGGFCRELVRRVVSLVQLVTESGDTDRIDTVLGDEPVAGPDGVPPADPHPLVLHAVAYDGLSFTVDEDAAERARTTFRAARADHHERARVAGHLASI